MITLQHPERKYDLLGYKITPYFAHSRSEEEEKLALKAHGQCATSVQTLVESKMACKEYIHARSNTGNNGRHDTQAVLRPSLPDFACCAAFRQL